MSIHWTPSTENFTVFTPIINPDDPNEPYETGYRNIYSPFPNYIIDEHKYLELHKILFADGPRLKFVKSDKFVGSLPGYVFYMGFKGLGYYIDPYVIRHVYFK